MFKLTYVVLSILSINFISASITNGNKDKITNEEIHKFEVLEKTKENALRHFYNDHFVHYNLEQRTSLFNLLQTISRNATEKEYSKTLRLELASLFPNKFPASESNAILQHPTSNYNPDDPLQMHVCLTKMFDQNCSRDILDNILEKNSQNIPCTVARLNQYYSLKNLKDKLFFAKQEKKLLNFMKNEAQKSEAIHWIKAFAPLSLSRGTQAVLNDSIGYQRDAVLNELGSIIYNQYLRRMSNTQTDLETLIHNQAAEDLIKNVQEGAKNVFHEKNNLLELLPEITIKSLNPKIWKLMKTYSITKHLEKLNSVNIPYEKPDPCFVQNMLHILTSKDTTQEEAELIIKLSRYVPINPSEFYRDMCGLKDLVLIMKKGANQQKENLKQLASNIFEQEDKNLTITNTTGWFPGLFNPQERANNVSEGDLLKLFEELRPEEFPNLFKYIVNGLKHAPEKDFLPIQKIVNIANLLDLPHLSNEQKDLIEKSIDNIGSTSSLDKYELQYLLQKTKSFSKNIKKELQKKTFFVHTTALDDVNTLIELHKEGLNIKFNQNSRDNGNLLKKILHLPSIEDQCKLINNLPLTEEVIYSTGIIKKNEILDDTGEVSIEEEIIEYNSLKEKTSLMKEFESWFKNDDPRFNALAKNPSTQSLLLRCAPPTTCFKQNIEINEASGFLADCIKNYDSLSNKQQKQVIALIHDKIDGGIFSSKSEEILLRKLINESESLRENFIQDLVAKKQPTQNYLNILIPNYYKMLISNS